MPHLAPIFKSCDTQLVLLPEEFSFDVSHVEVTREGDALILRPHVQISEPWASLKKVIELGGFSEDFLAAVQEQPEAPENPNDKEILP